jgi:hypothetical protein
MPQDRARWTPACRKDQNGDSSTPTCGRVGGRRNSSSRNRGESPQNKGRSTVSHCKSDGSSMGILPMSAGKTPGSIKSPQTEGRSTVSRCKSDGSLKGPRRSPTVHGQDAHATGRPDTSVRKQKSRAPALQSDRPFKVSVIQLRLPASLCSRGLSPTTERGL